MKRPFFVHFDADQITVTYYLPTNTLTITPLDVSDNIYTR